MRDVDVSELCKNVYRPIKGTFRIYKTKPKTSLEQSVIEMIDEAKSKKCLILSEFKGVPLMVNSSSSVAGILKAYQTELKSRMKEGKPLRKSVINLKQTYAFDRQIGDIHTVTDNMIQVATALQGFVFSDFNSIPVVVNQHSTLEGVTNGYLLECDTQHEEYLRSAEGVKRAQAEKKREIEDYKLGVQVDELIKNEDLHIVSPIHFNKMKTNADREGYGAVVEVASRWGRLMQVEMRKQNKTMLTKSIAESAYEMAEAGKSAYKLSGATYGLARNVLVLCWKNGRELAQLEQHNMKKVDKVRHEIQSAEKSVKGPTVTKSKFIKARD